MTVKRRIGIPSARETIMTFFPGFLTADTLVVDDDEGHSEKVVEVALQSGKVSPAEQGQMVVHTWENYVVFLGLTLLVQCCPLMVNWFSGEYILRFEIGTTHGDGLEVGGGERWPVSLENCQRCEEHGRRRTYLVAVVFLERSCINGHERRTKNSYVDVAAPRDEEPSGLGLFSSI
jgi:hypothetical protein